MLFRSKPTAKAKTCKPKSVTKGPAKTAKTKLSYKEKFELEKKREKLKAVTPLIEKLESDLEELQTKMSAQNYFKNTAADMATDQKRLENIESELETAYAIWEKLEAALEGVELD